MQNNPINLSDPTGHCPWCLAGAAIGGITGAILYGISEHQQGGFDFKNKGDWTDLLVAAGTGATAGFLIGTGVGATAGLAMIAGSAGTGMGIALLADHAHNIVKGTNFSALHHLDVGAEGAVIGAFTGAVSWAAKGAGLVEKMVVGAWGASGGYGAYNITKGAIMDSEFLEGLITAGALEAFSVGVGHVTKSELVEKGTSTSLEVLKTINNSNPASPAFGMTGSHAPTIPQRFCTGGMTCRE